MPKLPDLFVNAVSTWDGKALAKGQKQIGGFEKSVKNLAKAFGVTFGAAALAQFGKASVKAFAEDEAATVRLTKAVNNLGLGFEDTRIKQFISDLEASAHVADDILRPAFQSLISTTGSVTKSQDLLNLALEISAGTGIDAGEVAKDLSLAYLGQTKSLTKYNTGLTKTELAAAGFLTIQEKLTAQYSGSNAARLDTYSGKVAAVQIAYGNLQETVGGALVDAFMKLAGDTTVDDLTDSVDNLADSLAAVVELTGAVATPFVGLAKLFNNASMAYTKLLYKATGTAFMGDKRDRQYGGAAADKYRAIEEKANAKARAKAEAEAAKRQKEILALQKKSELAKKNELSLSKAAAEFDSNRISIAAALRNTYDKETRLRLEALMAIEDEKGDLALSKLRELGLLQEATDARKLAGIKTISDENLFALNARLLKELQVINDSQMAEKDKEIAREEAFKKYNAAIIMAGGLAAEESYKESTRIQLNQIEKLAALSKTESAARTGILLVQAEELNAINVVKNAQAAADAQRMANLQSYIAALKSLGSVSTGAGTLSTSGGVDPALTAAIAAAKKAQDEALAAKAKLDKATGDAIEAAAAAAESASKIAAESAAALSELADAVAAEKDATAAQTLGETSAALAELADALAAELDATGTIGSMPELESLAAEGLLPTYTEVPTGGAFDRDYTINITAGVIASQDEFTALLQDTIQQLNRNGDPLTTAGIA